jgi:hypothetical protein
VGGKVESIGWEILNGAFDLPEPVDILVHFAS